jgi:protein-L-isoaspartate(D-aspartate) O-methyltransferase
MNLDNVEQARFNMIEQQIRPWNVEDAQVLALLSIVRREEFVPKSHEALAFADLEIPLGNNQCMLAPAVQGRLLQEAAIMPTDKVLEIGTGSGFMTAMLARQAQRVISLEINPDIADMARANLQQAEVHNFEVRQADGALGAPAEAPFDVILLGGSVAQVPQTLLNQLKIGGRLVGIVGEHPVMLATVVTRTSETHFKTDTSWATIAPRLQNFPQSSSFKF